MADFDDRAMQAFIQDLQSGGLSYDEVKQRYRELGDVIRRRYEREISALAVDVVHSELAKGEDPLNAQMTFDAYHHWVEDVLRHYQCDGSHTWSGDGLLAVFTRPEPAVFAGRHLIDSLAMFNARYNRTSRPIRIRVGVHTGPILTDEAGGIGKIASRTFDVAGHLQKSAAPNQIRISETTYTLLSEGGGEFIAITTEPPSPGACFAYPAHVTLMGAAALPPPQHAVPPAGPPPRPASFVPWLFAVAGVALSVGVVLGVSALWPRTQAERDVSPPGAQSPDYRQEPANSGVTSAPSAAKPLRPGPGGDSQTPAAETTPVAAPPSRPTPPDWEPSRQLWQSADARSGLPPRLLPSPPEMKWVLAIGVGAYQEPSLAASGASQDAVLAVNALRQHAAVPPDHVRLLTDGQATRDGIKQAFKWLQQSATSGKDTIYLYVTGTALIAPDRSDLKHTGGTSYALFPHDTRLEEATQYAIYGADLAAWLGATAAQTVVLVLDTSHAAACDLPANPDAGRGIALLSSAGAFQQGRARSGRETGAFAEFFAQALAGAADADRDGRVALTELKPYLELEMGRATLGAQTVDLRGGFGGQVPDLHFATVRR
jgi:class 3 adenylate cyclase